jgi:hypothetical protein
MFQPIAALSGDTMISLAFAALLAQAPVVAPPPPADRAPVVQVKKTAPPKAKAKPKAKKPAPKKVKPVK